MSTAIAMEPEVRERITAITGALCAIYGKDVITQVQQHLDLDPFIKPRLRFVVEDTPFEACIVGACNLVAAGSWPMRPTMDHAYPSYGTAGRYAGEALGRELTAGELGMIQEAMQLWDSFWRAHHDDLATAYFACADGEEGLLP